MRPLPAVGARPLTRCHPRRPSPARPFPQGSGRAAGAAAWLPRATSTRCRTPPARRPARIHRLLRPSGRSGSCSRRTRRRCEPSPCPSGTRATQGRESARSQERDPASRVSLHACTGRSTRCIGAVPARRAPAGARAGPPRPRARARRARTTAVSASGGSDRDRSCRGGQSLPRARDPAKSRTTGAST